VPVPNDPATVRAAGGLLWRPANGRNSIEVALVHRPRYRDWSLPKGKAEPGEQPTLTAWREIKEETGFDAVLGRRLTTVRYVVAAGPKVVEYFAARAGDGGFTPNREVDMLRWVSPSAARSLLSYEFDVAVLDNFAVQPADLTSVVLVRHAKAGAREAWDGPDELRPLDAKGRKQAAALRDELVPFGAAALHSAPIERCRETLVPLSRRVSLPIQQQPSLTESAYRDNPATARRLVSDLAKDGRPATVCSQGGVIPGVVKSLAGRADVTVGSTSTPKSAYWVLTFDSDTLVQADLYPAPPVS
jgi:8-oxo-(d)GTP phosphatase